MEVRYGMDIKYRIYKYILSLFGRSSIHDIQNKKEKENCCHSHNKLTLLKLKIRTKNINTIFHGFPFYS